MRIVDPYDLRLIKRMIKTKTDSVTSRDLGSDESMSADNGSGETSGKA